MSTFFADTFYWIATTNLRDLAYQQVQALRLPADPGVICTTEEVLTEYLNYFAGWGPQFRLKASTNVQRIRWSRNVRIINQTSESFQNGLKMYSSRLDKGYSLTDCISMQTMRQEGLSEALTNDRHFEQEGFRALFRRAES